MFRKLIALVLVVTIVAARPQPAQSRSSGGGDESQVETSNDRKNTNGNIAVIEPAGQRYEIVYVADENGFQPKDAHPPAEPPAPDDVIKMLEDMLANPPEDVDIQSLQDTLNRLRATQG